jgi:hypothetical protein
VWSHEFSVLVPRTDEASLTLSGGASPGPQRVYPLWPAGVRTQSLPEEGIAGKLYYVGAGEFSDLPVSSLDGQIAVLESTCGGNWRTAFALGARAVLLLGSESESFPDLQSHILPVPFFFPRYYVPAGSLAEQLRGLRGGSVSGTLRCTQQWVEAEARNLYALVQAAPGSEPRQALAVAVPMDSMSVIPELAPGADVAVDMGVALELLRRFSEAPPAHPVLFAFVDAYGINQLGMRHMLMALGAMPEFITDLGTEDRDKLEGYRKHDELARILESEPDPLAAMHENRYRPLHDYIKQEVQQDVLVIDARLEPLRLQQFSADEAAKEALREKIAQLETRRFRYYRAQNQLLQSQPIRDDAREQCQTLWNRARQRIRGQLQRVQNIVDRDTEYDQYRRKVVAALGLEDTEERPLRPISFLLGIDLSDSGIACGPSLQDDFLGYNETRNATEFTRWLQLRTKAGAQPIWAHPAGADTGGGEPALPRAVNLQPLSGLESPSSHMVGQTANITAAAPSFGLPAMSWSTLDGLHLRVDTPQDLPERLNWDRLTPQIDATIALVDAWCNDAAFSTPAKVPLSHLLRIRAAVVDQAAGEPVARVPMAGYLTTLLYGNGEYVRPVGATPGVRNHEFVRTGADGEVAFDTIPADVGWFARLLGFHAYEVDESGRIVRVVNQAKSGKTVQVNVDRNWRKSQPLRAVVFSCREHSLADLYDPRFLLPLPQATTLDSRRGNPKRLNQLLYEGMLCFFLEHNVRWQLLLRAGIVGNRMVLVNALPPSEAADLSVRDSLLGFRDVSMLDGHPFQVSARDFYRLDARRLEDYRKAGIANKAIAGMQEQTRAALDEADDAYRADDGDRYFRAAMGAMANEVRAYQAVRRTADDVIRGAIFLLLVLLPFAYAMERLLFASPHVYRQIGGTAGIFAVMTAILWSFHPAFRMSTMPLMIVMAFGVIVMSLLVIAMIFSKFENELEKMRSGKAESSSAKTSRFGLVSTAVRLGIANMRKRKLRTALTGVTIVLITFALLSFMSASTYVAKSEYSLDVETGAPAVLVRQPGERQLPHEARAFLKNLVGRERTVIPRYWWCNSWDPQWRIHIRNPRTGKQISLTAAVGLEPDEDNVSGIGRVCHNWKAFERGNGIYLAKQNAEELGVKPGETVVVGGQVLTLLHGFDSGEFDSTVRRLDGKSLLPPDYSSMDDQERRQKSRADIQTLMLELESGNAQEDDTGMPPLSSDQIAVIHADRLEGIRSTSLRSMSIPVSSTSEARSLAAELSDKLAFPIYFGSSDGVHVVAATPLAPKAPKSLIIPLLIAGFIIFNTMLSSLAERRNEIYIYTSLGLAPMHIGILFLAEAVTYGLLGSICGYVIGQGVATMFSALGWMGGITLNFGGTQAMVTMCLVLAIVVVSSLAFTATSQTAAGVAAFLYEYFEAHEDGAIGHFTTAELAMSQTRGADGADEVRVEGTVWLAPYDLGVRQTMALRVSRMLDESEDLYDISIDLRHEAGQTRNWHRLNRTFLGNLRRQMLGWRKLNADRVIAYITQGRRRLEQPPSRHA